MKYLYIFIIATLYHSGPAQIKPGKLNYVFNTSSVTAFHWLEDGSMIANLQLPSSHEICESKGGGTKWALRRFNAAGEVLWQKCFNKGSQRITRIEPYGSNMLVCYGSTNNHPKRSSTYSKLWIYIIDLEGNEVKNFYYDSPVIPYQYNVEYGTQTADGGFIVGGDINRDTKYYQEGIELDMLLIKLDENGQEEWHQQIDIAYWDHIKSIIPLPDGYLVAAHVQHKKKTDENRGTAWLFKYNLNGNLVWKKNYGAGHYDFVGGMMLKNNGSVVCVGQESSEEKNVARNCGRRGFWIFQIDQNGNKHWENFLVNRSASKHTYGKNNSLLQLQNGHVLVGGSDLTDLKTSKFWVGQFDDHGNLVNETSPQNEHCQGVDHMVFRDGKLHMAGWQTGHHAMVGVWNYWICDAKLKQKKEHTILDSGHVAEEYHLQMTLNQPQKTEDPQLLVEYRQPTSISAYPNPAHNYIQLDLGRTVRSIQIQMFDQAGRLILNSSKSNKRSFNLSLDELKSGKYILHLLLDGELQIVKFIKV